MAPVLAPVLFRIGLVEQMPVPVPEAQAVGIVQAPFRVDIVEDGPVPVAGQPLPRRREIQHQRIGRQLRFLFRQGRAETVVRDRRAVVAGLGGNRGGKGHGKHKRCHGLDNQ